MKTQTHLPSKIWAFFIVTFLATPRVWALPEASQTRDATDEIAPVTIPLIIPQDSLTLPDPSINNTELLEDSISPSERELSRTLPVIETKQKSIKTGANQTLRQTKDGKTPFGPSLPVQTGQTLKKSEKEVAKTLAPFAHSLKESNALGALSRLMDGAGDSFFLGQNHRREN